MLKHICSCGYIYNPEYGDVNGDIEKGVSFDDLPDKWECPICGNKKERFIVKNKKSTIQFSL